MSTLLIRNVQLDGNVTNILIEGNRFANLTAPADTVADETYDASGLALVPSFFNTHTHASMTLLRGYADDLPLFPWLNDHIWPFEGILPRGLELHLTGDIISRPYINLNRPRFMEFQKSYRFRR